jgi:hypothetical protein
MSDVEHFALIVLVTAAAVVAAVVSNRLSERIRIPAPAIFSTILTRATSQGRVASVAS